ncbi:polysaccharide deacetylase family protein [Spirosoma endbachense]|uniref:Polysaccharide deacetylase family protein n=1 Tax=Spirosoma endbachense TaxID=2666025 RepID=A0A6P1VUA1_9BACT|nr:polysaccharide deacetylase family protein [Spirosoma endbachense]QHV95327.1 polysaccharide deacetylase family protein [Spirosoma endbachense]
MANPRLATRPSGLLTVVVTSLALVGFYLEINSRTFQLFGNLIYRVETDVKVVALTFDDGPTQYTGELVDLLQQQGVKATFFLIGSNLQKNPAYGSRLAEAGHEIGNHTFSHTRMILKTYATIEQEIEKTDSIIRAITGQREILFRPPYCKKFIGLPYYLREHNRKTITWDVEPESYADVRQSSKRIMQHVVDRTKPGSIILLHCMGTDDWKSRQSLRGLIVGLKKAGYQFVTVSELLRYRK